MKEESRFGIDIDEEFDEKSMEYYSMLRGLVEEAEVNYWIGNPSVEIINGTISLLPLHKPTQHCESTEQWFTALR